MSEGNKAIARRYLEEVWNKGNMAVADELIAENFVNHDALPGEAPDRDGIKQAATGLCTAFPDGYHSVQDMIAEADKVVIRGVFRGTHQGELLGIAPTGNEVTFPSIVILRIEDGKIMDRWAQFDMMGMMQQLGVIPAPGQFG